MGDVGDSEGWPDGRYIMVGTGSKTVAVISDPLSNMEPKPDQWLNKDFFKVEKIRSIAVAYPVATNSWKVTRDSETANDWKLSDAQARRETGFLQDLQPLLCPELPQLQRCPAAGHQARAGWPRQAHPADPGHL